MGHGPQGHKESDVTERLRMNAHRVMINLQEVNVCNILEMTLMLTSFSSLTF